MPARHQRRSLAVALWGVCLLVLAGAPAVSAATSPPPAVAAANAVVIGDYPGGQRVLFDRAMHAHVPPASLTKVMTALVALQHGDLAAQITAEPADLVGEASMGLRAGETLSLKTLLYGLLLPSGNDAAMAIARGVGAQPGDASGEVSVARFVGWMNETARRLGLDDTHFANPHGLDAPDHYSSPYDLARLTLAAWQQQAFAAIFSSTSYSGEGHGMIQGNHLVGNYPGVVGGKTGLTDRCGYCLITAARQQETRLVVVVMHDTADTAYTDTKALLAYGFAQPMPTPAPVAPAGVAPASAGQTPTVAALAASPASGYAARYQPTLPGRTSGHGQPWSLLVALALAGLGVVVVQHVLTGTTRRGSVGAAGRSGAVLDGAARQEPACRACAAAIAAACNGDRRGTRAAFSAAFAAAAAVDPAATPGFWAMPAQGHADLARVYLRCGQVAEARTVLKAALLAFPRQRELTDLLRATAPAGRRLSRQSRL
jgi:D-alanyl-D-alanine carboxypeptidase (penicillin-binding protein 5/6)